MLTPQEVANAVFPKSGLGTSGYKMSSVDDFLDKVTEDYKTLYAENITLKAKLKVLAEKAEEYRLTENALHTTLLTAQQTANSIVKDAEDRKAKVLVEARKEANDQIQEIESEIKVAQDKLASVQEELSTFINKSSVLCENQMVFLNKLSKLINTQKEEKEASPVIEAMNTVEEENAMEETIQEPGAEMVQDMDATMIYKAPLLNTEEEKKPEAEVIEDIEKGVEEIMSKGEDQKPSEEKAEEVSQNTSTLEGEFTRSLKELEWHFGKNVEISND